MGLEPFAFCLIFIRYFVLTLREFGEEIGGIPGFRDDQMNVSRVIDAYNVLFVPWVGFLAVLDARVSFVRQPSWTLTVSRLYFHECTAYSFVIVLS